MHLVIYYRKNSSHSREVERFINDLRMIKRIEPKIKDIDATESQITMRTYDITQYPVIIVRLESGQVQKIWQGTSMPLLNEVSGYMFNR